MEFGKAEILKQKGNTRLLKVGCKNGKVSYCVNGDGATRHYDDYDDALEEFNLRWMKATYD